MVPAGNKANRLSSVNHTTKTIHHHHHHQKNSLVIVSWEDKYLAFHRFNDELASLSWITQQTFDFELFMLRLSQELMFFCFFFLSGFSFTNTDVLGQQGKRGDHFLFHSTTSTHSRTFRHLLTTLHGRWLSHIF